MQDSKKILIVDDAVSSQELMMISLQKYNIEIVRAYNGREAIEKAASEKPVLIMMDLKMPGIDGFEAIRAIRSNPDMTDVPIIVLTALYGEEERQEALEAGCNYFMAKPFRLGELRKVVEKFLTEQG